MTPPDSRRILLRACSLRALGFIVESPTTPSDLTQPRRSNAQTPVEVRTPAGAPMLTSELARVLLRILQRANRPDTVPEDRCQTDGVAS